MAKVYNLSYDIATKYCEENNIKLDRDDIVKEMIEKGIILLNQEFNIYSNGVIMEKHLVVYPVRTTIIFYSNCEQDYIASFLAQYGESLFYVLTEVKDDVDTYIARLRSDDELQQNFENKLDQIKKTISNKR